MSGTYNIDEMAPSYQTEGYSIFKREDNIVRLKFVPGYTINVEDAENVMAHLQRLNGGVKCLLLVVFEEDNIFSMETRKYMSSDFITGIVKAHAFVMPGLALKILGDGYLKINKPKQPTRIFSSENIAVKWLQQYA